MWEYFGAGNSYQRGQYANGLQWWFYGASGNNLLSVTSSDYTTPASMNPTNETFNMLGFVSTAIKQMTEPIRQQRFISSMGTIQSFGTLGSHKSPAQQSKEIAEFRGG